MFQKVLFFLVLAWPAVLSGAESKPGWKPLVNLNAMVLRADGTSSILSGGIGPGIEYAFKNGLGVGFEVAVQSEQIKTEDGETKTFSDGSWIVQVRLLHDLGIGFGQRFWKAGSGFNVLGDDGFNAVRSDDMFLTITLKLI